MKYKFILFAFCLSQLVQAESLQVSKSPPFFDFDITGSSGNYNGKTYSEVQVGVNMNFAEWLTWRNAAFKRQNSGTERDLSGFDSSLRFSYKPQLESVALKFFAGPGYRWADRSDKNALFGEAGATLQLGRLGAGAGVKLMKYDKAQFDSAGNSTRQEDISYFISVAGGAGLSF